MIVLDIETTGLSPENNEIIEFAGIFVGEDYSEVSSFTTLIRPKKPLPEHITQLTGLTMDALQYAPTIEQIQPTLKAYIYNHQLIGHNIKKFDAPFLKQNNILNRNKLIDTLEISRDKRKTEKHSLDYLCNYYGIMREQTHRALDDSRATLQLYKILKGRNLKSRITAEGVSYNTTHY